MKKTTTKRKSKTTKRPTKRVAAHRATNPITEKAKAKIMSVLRKTGRKYIGSTKLASTISATTSWTAVLVRRLCEEGKSIESKRGTAGGYRLALT